MPGPDPVPIAALIRNFNAWRKGIAWPFLHLGRMEKPFPIEGARDVPVMLKHGGPLPWPSLMTSRWTSPDGREAQIVANYLSDSQACTLRLGSDAGRGVRVYENPSLNESRLVDVKDGGIELMIAPLSAIMVEWVR